MNENPVIPCEYDGARCFSEGAAPVKRGEKWGVIDRDNHVIVDFIYDKATFNQLTAWPYWVKKGDFWGCIDSNGNVVIPFEYFYGDSYNYNPTLFSDGLSSAEKDGKWGVLDAKGQTVIPFDYDLTYYIEKGIVFAKADEKGYLIDTKSDNKIIASVDDTYSRGPAYRETGYIVVKINGKWGVMDTDGNLIVPCNRESAYTCLAENLLAVYVNAQFEFIDFSGNQAFSACFDDVTELTGGLIKVSKRGKLGIIDTNGNEIVPIQHDEINYGDGYLTMLKDGYVFIAPKDAL